MLAEGCFNILDHTTKSASSDLKAAALQVKDRTVPPPTPRNDTSLMFVCLQVNKDGDKDLRNNDLSAKIREKKEETRAYNNDPKRKDEILAGLQKK